MDPIEKIIRENCWKFDKGYPDSQEDINYLKTLIEQEIETEEVDSIVPGDESGEQQEKVVDVIKKYKKEDIIALFQSLELDQEQLNKLFNRVNNFKSYRPIRQEVDKAGWNEKIRKKFAKEIQDLIEDLSIEDKQKFINYLNSDKIDFLDVVPEDGVGKLANTLASTGVPLDVVSKIITHTSQDEGKRGVGMGEVGLTLLFGDVNASGGKGDLAIDGKEFEIKGNGARLGPEPFNLISAFNDKLGKYGINVKGGSGKGGIMLNDKPYTMGELSQVLVDAYNATEDKEGFKAAFKDILVNDNKLGSKEVDARFNNIDFTKPESFNTEIGLMNFIRYAKKEGFTHFLTHDYGTSRGSPNNGNYIYVSGDAENMAKKLKAGKVKFQTITPNALRPRMGFNTTYKEE
jgi:hypothetical protein